MVIGDKYNWGGQDGKLVYIGKSGSLYRFALTSKPDRVWCEVTESDLHLIERTKV